MYKYIVAVNFIQEKPTQTDPDDRKYTKYCVTKQRINTKKNISVGATLNNESTAELSPP